MIVMVSSLSGSKGLSKLLSILIGLAVVIVAGIALTNSFYQYVYPVSIRPAMMIEYVDLVEAGDNDILILNLKNTGNVPVDVQRVVIEGVGDADCRVAGSGSPGSTFSIICSGDIVGGYGSSVSGILRIEFMDGSSMALVFTAGRGQAAIIRTITDTITETETTTEAPTIIVQDFTIYVLNKTVSGIVGQAAQVTVRMQCHHTYSGRITLSYSGDVKGGVFHPNPVSINGQYNQYDEVIFSFTIAKPGNRVVTVIGIDENGITRSDTFRVFGKKMKEK
jgi:hypothetical protein